MKNLKWFIALILVVGIIVVVYMSMNKDTAESYSFSLSDLDKSIELKKASIVSGSQEVETRDKIEGFLSDIGTGVRDNFDIYIDLSIYYNLLGEGQKAVEMLEKAISIDPDNPRGYQQLGILLMKYNAHNSAREAFEKALELDPDSVSSNQLAMNLYSSFLNLDNEEIIEKYEDALERTNRNMLILTDYVRWLESRDLYGEAIEVYEEILEKSPDNSDEIMRDLEILRSKI